MKAMILAAGFGKRMLHLTAKTPKPLLKVAGKSLIEYHIESLSAIGITEIVINHAYLGTQIEAFLGTGEKYGVSIQYSAEDSPLETAGGIVKALPLLGDESFLLVNGDIWTNYIFSSLLTLPMSSLAHLVLVTNPLHHPQGDFCLLENALLKPVDLNNTKLSQGFTYSGIALISPELFKHYDVSTGPLAPLLRLAMDNSQISGEFFDGEWFDVGTPERLLEVSNFVKSQP